MTLPAETAAPAETAKCRQILDGARRCFLASGFEAASMGEIAREAGVSKGTLYVYFDSKEALFTSLIEESKRQSAERLILIEAGGEDIRQVLVNFATELILRLTSPDHIAILRVVIGASDRFPELARSFYEAGPAHGVRVVAQYLDGLVHDGRIGIADTEMAAWQLLALCAHPVLTRVLIGRQPPPTPADAHRIAEAGIGLFLAAHPPITGAAPGHPD